MNNVVLMGRLTADPTIHYTKGEKPIPVARYNLAVNRARKKEGQQEADFIPCIAFSGGAEFAQKYLRKGMRIVVRGHLQSGRYTKDDGSTVFTLDLIVDEHEFADVKRTDAPDPESQGWIDAANTAAALGDEDLPFR